LNNVLIYGILRHMKSSNSCEVIAVLDTPAELGVVHGAIQHLLDPVSSETPTRADIASRFYTQTREWHDPQICLATGMVLHGERWKMGAEFEILATDESLVLAAARRISEERNKFKRLANNISGATGAAKVMLGFFETDRKWRDWDSIKI
jgi:hypothetical protein